MLFKDSTHLLKRRAINKKLKRSLIKNNVSINYRYKEFSVYIPHMWDVVILSNLLSNSNVFRLTSTTYYSNFAFKNSLGFIYFDKFTRVVTFKSTFTNAYYLLFLRSLEAALVSFTKPSFVKLKFKGKGYYIYKNNRNTIAPQFGYSHRVYIYSYFTSVKFLGKTKVMVFGFNKTDILSSSLLIKSKRPINIFTGRGVRFSRQVIYKKQGKVSSYR